MTKEARAYLKELDRWIDTKIFEPLRNLGGWCCELSQERYQADWIEAEKTIRKEVRQRFLECYQDGLNAAKFDLGEVTARLEKATRETTKGDSRKK